ncbi:MAG: VWA domain-containing protein [Gemmataceae bacterium]|nr:VWA domain-containing protein [Gemmataceae bacterium]
MTKTLLILSDDEVKHLAPGDEEAGFGAVSTPRGQLPLKAMDVHARIDGLLGQVTLAQTFVNTHEVALEATYVFPLPDRHAVTHFRMEVNGRIIDGVLRERGAARRDYDQAIQAGHRAAITEEERPGVFTMRVGNLMPGEEATVRLVLVGPLAYSDGEATFRFPLVVAPRYIPGRALAGSSVGSGMASDTDAVPDASRITPPILLPGFPNPVALKLTADVHSGGLPLGEVRSSLHAVVINEAPGKTCVAIQPGERLNRDFILRFKLGAGAICTSLLLKPDASVESQEGTFLLTIVPPTAAALAQKPRDVVFVLDRSGSMDGWKMVAARRALARMVDTLSDRDRFTVYAFDDAIEAPAFGTGLVSATDRHRFRAVEFLAKIEGRNGTEMAGPLDLAVRQLQAGAADRQRILVLVTDGQVGNEDQILQTLSQRLQGIRVFALGIDQAVNEAFLRRLALLGGGACDVVESEDRLDAVMDKVHRRIAEPVCTGLQLQASGLRIDGDALVPTRLPDLFAGAPLTILGRYRGVAEGQITVEARDAAGRPWSESLPARASNSAAVASMWARGHIRDLEDQFVIGHGDRAALEKRIIDTSLRFSVLCRFTAFVAVDHATIVNRGGPLHRVTQAVEAPAGWDMFKADEAGELRKRQNIAEPVEREALAKSGLPVEQSLADNGIVSGLPPTPGVDSEFELCLELDEDVSDEEAAESADAMKDIFEADFDLAMDDSVEQQGDKPHADGKAAKSKQANAGDEQRRFAEKACAESQNAAPADRAACAAPLAAPGMNRGIALGACAVPAGKFRGTRPAPGKPGTGGSGGHGPSIDLSAYRQRVHELLEQMTDGDTTETEMRLARLGVVAEKLAALVEDLRSVDAPEQEIWMLVELLDQLRALFAAAPPVDNAILRAWTATEQAFEAFTIGVGAAGATRDESFWK